MKSLVALATMLTIAAWLTAAAAPLGGGVPAAVHYIGHDEGDRDDGERRTDRRRSAAWWCWPIARGRVKWNTTNMSCHIFLMVEGKRHCGGRNHGRGQRTSADQMVAASIEGGDVHHLSKGDVITIPAKTPHWWKEVPTKTVAYYAVNIESQ